MAVKFSLKILAFHRNNEEGARIKNKEGSNRFFKLRIVIKNDLHLFFYSFILSFFFSKEEKAAFLSFLL